MADTIDRLEIQVQTQAQRANAELDKLANRLESIASVLSRVNGSGFQGLANGINRLSTSMQNMSAVKTTDFTRLAKNIEKLGNINQAGINNTASALRQISSALTASTISGDALKGLSDLANGISRLGYKSVSNAITNLPLLANAMRQFMATLSTAPQVSANLIQMTNAMANLAAQGSKYSSTIKSAVGATNAFKSANTKAEKSSISLIATLGKLSVAYFILRRAVRAAVAPIKSAMDFGETVNLFQTSFKKIGMDAAEDAGLAWGSDAADAYAKSFINRAQAFNDKITEALSLDPNLMMNYQAVFAQMANSMGLAADTAENISESFTLLGNDIASLWNIDTEEAMVKLQAGLTGQVKPLRELGIDITQSSLQLTAYKHGIDKNVESMTQAEKVQLRWLTVMEQAEVAFGDMAKTIESPANQVRILKQQWENFTRTLGQALLPIATTVLPYINALIIALQRLMSTIAGAMGYELPDYTNSDIYKDITGDIEGIGDSADNTTDSVNKLKKSLAGFDKLNVLSENNTKTINIDTGSGNPLLDDAIGQTTESYMEKFRSELGKTQNKAKELADEIEPKLRSFAQWLKALSPLFIGVATSAGAVAIANFFIGLAEKIGAFNPTVGVVALAIGAFAAIGSALLQARKDAIKADLEGRFGNIKLSMEEVKVLADEMSATEYDVNIDVYVNEKAKLGDLQNKIQTDIDTLNKLNWKVSVGMELTPDEVGTYKQTIESFITDADAYITQQQYVVTLALNAVINTDDNFKAEMTALVNEYFNSSRGEMQRLGEELRSEIDKALADGVLDEKEQEVVGNLIKEINDVMSKVSDAEFQAKLQMITVDGELTPDSFKDLTKQIQDAIDKKLEDEKEAYFTALTYINIAYKEKIENATTPEEKAQLQAQWDADVKQLADEFSETQATITLTGWDFSMGTLIDKFGVSLDGIAPDFQSTIQTVMDTVAFQGIIDSDPTYAMDTLASKLYDTYDNALDAVKLDSASAAALNEMLGALAPSTNQLDEIYENALKAGAELPQGVSDALTDYNQLAVLGGDMDAIWFLLGQKMSTDQTFLDLLETGEVAGKDLPDYFVQGLKTKIPSLKASGENMILSVGKSVKSEAKTTGKSNMSTGAGSMINGFTGKFNKDTSGKTSIKDWLDGIAGVVSAYKLPSLNMKVAVDMSEVETLQDYYGLAKIPGTFVSQYASGGFPNTGEMFIARENGIPEMVGRIGNRTAVANNDQIASALEEAAYRGYVRAIADTKGYSGNTNVTVALEGDAKGLFKVIQKGSREYYNMTGLAPFPA